MKCTRAKSPGYPQKGGCSLIQWLQTYLLIIEKVQPYLILIDNVCKVHYPTTQCACYPPSPHNAKHPCNHEVEGEGYDSYC